VVTSLAIPAITITSGTATTLAALGLIKLKAAALLALTRRGRRQAEDVNLNLVGHPQEILWKSVAKLEDGHKCVRRFLCEVAAGKLVAEDYVDVVKDLVGSSLDGIVDAAKEPYARAAKRGSTHKNADKCQNDYLCEFTGKQIYNKLNLF
jgi:hypothetical protein